MPSMTKDFRIFATMTHGRQNSDNHKKRMMSQDINITLRSGRKEDAGHIAGLIITAMT